MKELTAKNAKNAKKEEDKKDFGTFSGSRNELLFKKSVMRFRERFLKSIRYLSC